MDNLQKIQVEFIQETKNSYEHVKRIQLFYSAEYTGYLEFLDASKNTFENISALSYQRNAGNHSRGSAKISLKFEIPEDNLLDEQIREYKDAVLLTSGAARKVSWSFGSSKSNERQCQLFRVKFTFPNMDMDVASVILEMLNRFPLLKHDESAYAITSSLSSAANSPRVLPGGVGSDDGKNGEENVVVVENMRHSIESEHRLSAFYDAENPPSSAVIEPVCRNCGRIFSTEMVSTKL